MRALGGTVKKAMTPDACVNTASMTEGDASVLAATVRVTFIFSVEIETYLTLSFAALDGDQVLDFYWIDPIDVAKRFISKPKFSGKLYTQYRRQNSTQRPGKRAFGRANSGLVFQACQAVDMFSSPLLLLFYADKSFSGKHRTHHPIYSKCSKPFIKHSKNI